MTLFMFPHYQCNMNYEYFKVLIKFADSTQQCDCSKVLGPHVHMPLKRSSKHP